MRTFFVFILFASSIYGQDSVAKKKIELSVQGIPYPILYLVWIGYGGVGYVEATYNNKYSIAIGAKSQKSGFISGNPTFNADMIIVEPRYYFSNTNKEKYYLSPYAKIRKMHYSEYDGYQTSTYEESGLGLGLNLGIKSLFDSKGKIFFNGFIGGGWFLPLSSESDISRIPPWMEPNFKPSELYRGIDLRIGGLFGYNF